MNPGHGYHEFIDEEQKKELIGGEIPIFEVGETVEVKGMPYRVHRIERKKLVLKPLKVQLKKTER